MHLLLSVFSGDGQIRALRFPNQARVEAPADVCSHSQCPEAPVSANTRPASSLPLRGERRFATGRVTDVSDVGALSSSSSSTQRGVGLLEGRENNVSDETTTSRWLACLSGFAYNANLKLHRDGPT